MSKEEYYKVKEDIKSISSKYKTIYARSGDIVTMIDYGRFGTSIVEDYKGSRFPIRTNKLDKMP